MKRSKNKLINFWGTWNIIIVNFKWSLKFTWLWVKIIQVIDSTDHYLEVELVSEFEFNFGDHKRWSKCPSLETETAV